MGLAANALSTSATLQVVNPYKIPKLRRGQNKRPKYPDANPATPMDTIEATNIPNNPPMAMAYAPFLSTTNALNPKAIVNSVNRNPSPTATKAPVKIADQEIRLYE